MIKASSFTALLFIFASSFANAHIIEMDITAWYKRDDVHALQFKNITALQPNWSSTTETVKVREQRAAGLATPQLPLPQGRGQPRAASGGRAHGVAAGRLRRQVPGARAAAELFLRS